MAWRRLGHKTKDPPAVWLWVLSRYLEVAQRPRQTVIRVPVMGIGIDDIVWIAGDILNDQYTRSRAVIRTAFSMGQIEKAGRGGLKSDLLLSFAGYLEILQNFHRPNRNSELYFCPPLEVPKRYTATVVRSCSSLGKFLCSFGRHKTVCRRDRVFMILRTSTTLVEWDLSPAFAVSKATRSSSREFRFSSI